MDLLEPHLLTSSVTDFHERVGYDFEFFTPSGFDNVVKNAEALYRKDPPHWQKLLRACVQEAATGSRVTGRPLITTECWGIVDYKDWPLLDWGRVKELCEIGVLEAISTGRWAGIATSNFCGPQFVGMWRGVVWHQNLTKQIRSAAATPHEVPLQPSS